MKKNWTKLLSKFACGEKKEYEFNRAFVKHHHHACEMIFDPTTGQPLAAIYFTPHAIHKESVKLIFQQIRERLYYSADFKNEKKVTENDDT